MSVPGHQQPGLRGLSQGTPGVVPCQTRSAPAAPTDPPQCMARPVSQDGAVSMNMHSRAEKAARKKEREENKRSEKLHRNTKPRDKEEK